MAYTVKKIAEISGVSVRTLHFYDEIGLLKPAFTGDNGYRYYEEKQLLKLQQILFFRELGIELKNIQVLLKQADFDQLLALKSHRKFLEQECKRLKKLILTIDKTVRKLKGEKTMKNTEMFAGFDAQKQKNYEAYLIENGYTNNQSIKNVATKTKSWSKLKWETVKASGNAFNVEIAQLFQRGLEPNDAAIQVLLEKHFIWISQFWQPTKEKYIGLGKLYLENEEFKKYFDSYADGLAKFLAKAMKIYANKNLS